MPSTKKLFVSIMLSLKQLFLKSLHPLCYLYDSECLVKWECNSHNCVRYVGLHIPTYQATAKVFGMTFMVDGIWNCPALTCNLCILNNNSGGSTTLMNTDFKCYTWHRVIKLFQKSYTCKWIRGGMSLYKCWGFAQLEHLWDWINFILLTDHNNKNIISLRYKTCIIISVNNNHV